MHGKGFFEFVTFAHTSCISHCKRVEGDIHCNVN